MGEGAAELHMPVVEDEEEEGSISQSFITFCALVNYSAS